MAEHIRGLIRMYAIHGVKDDGAIDLMYDIFFWTQSLQGTLHSFRGCGSSGHQPNHDISNGGVGSGRFFGTVSIKLGCR
jgi:hypothetical protein